MRYAIIHIEELKRYAKSGSNDTWENAHQESSFFHLAGAVDAFLHEINDGYSLELDIAQVNWRGVARRLGKTGQTSRAFKRGVQLREERGSWVDLLFEWRNHGTHRRHVGKDVWIGKDNQFKDPRTGRVPDEFANMSCQQVLEDLAGRVRKLVDYFRAADPYLQKIENGKADG